MRSKSRFGMLGQRPSDTADLLVGVSGQQPAFSVSLAPEPGCGEGEQREGPAFLADLAEHVVDQSLVLEPESGDERRLHEGATQRGSLGRAYQGQLGDDR